MGTLAQRAGNQMSTCCHICGLNSKHCSLCCTLQVKVPSLKPFSVVDVPGLNYQSPYQFGITQSFLESAETDLVVLLLPCGTRKTPAVCSQSSASQVHIRPCAEQKVLSKLAAADGQFHITEELSNLLFTPD